MLLQQVPAAQTHPHGAGGADVPRLPVLDVAGGAGDGVHRILGADEALMVAEALEVARPQGRRVEDGVVVGGGPVVAAEQHDGARQLRLLAVGERRGLGEGDLLAHHAERGARARRGGSIGGDEAATTGGRSGGRDLI